MYLLKVNDFVVESIWKKMVEQNILFINIILLVGSGKIMLLQEIVCCIGDKVNMKILVGDLEIERDVDWFWDVGVDVLQIVIGGICYLEV